jgi:hypothetical protein
MILSEIQRMALINALLCISLMALTGKEKK